MSLISIRLTPDAATSLALVFVLAILLFGCASENRSVSTAGDESKPSIVTESAEVAALENKLVRRPGNGVEDGKVYLVQGGKKRWVVNASWLTEHGYRFPEDIQVISPADLDAIQSGDPIQ